MKWLSRLFLKITGWRIINDIPPSLKKYVVAVAPHTSWKDFPLGLFVRTAMDRNIYYLGKKELFDGPFGFFFWWTGGRPVDRRNKTGLVDQVAKLFAGSEEFAIAIAPEGTRKKVDDLKTGFYFIAKAAGVPVIPCLMDYEHKTIHFLKPFYPGDDAEKDLDTLWSLYRGVKGARPEYGIEGNRKQVSEVRNY
jgi:1-acyl-sn-glycerol-3-phosphate acyltransferase